MPRQKKNPEESYQWGKVFERQVRKAVRANETDEERRNRIRKWLQQHYPHVIKNA